MPQTMKALTYSRYGPPQVVSVTDIPCPVPGPEDVVVRVHASGVNTADWRIRAAAFPGILAIPARLMFGLFRPRNSRLGSEFSGVVEHVGPSVTRFRPHDRVYGMIPNGGATAEVLAVPHTAAIALIPRSIDVEDAAGLPFGGLSALEFLTTFGQVQPGHRVLVVGGSGGVGVYAIQIAKALGATVTGVAGSRNQSLMRTLGADTTLNYQTTHSDTWPGDFDVILDTVGSLSPRQARRLLTDTGLFLPLNFGLREIGAALLNPFRQSKVRLAVNDDTAEGLDQLNTLIEAGSLKPVIETSYPLHKAVDAHAHVQTRHRRGALVLRMPVAQQADAHDAQPKTGQST